jgi:methylmalonyl-CoA mutase C-terminal domain/subunit
MADLTAQAKSSSGSSAGSSLVSSPIRVLVAKPGLDGHDRGAKVVARGLRDAGFEVIYTGLHQTPEMVVAAALQEDVDIIGLSILSGAHLPLVQAVQDRLVQLKLDKPLFVGGIIPPDDAKTLLDHGVAAVFGPGSSIPDIVKRIKEIVAAREASVG